MKKYISKFVLGWEGYWKATEPDGIAIAPDTRILPGLSNSFALREETSWHQRNGFFVYFFAITILVLAIFYLGLNLSFTYSDSDLDKIALTVDLGDLVSKPKTQANVVEIDEIFGNEFVKKKVDPNEEDARAATAANPYIGGATMPVDLTPDVSPEYTAAARAAGVQGTVTLELVVSEEGTVLRARPVGKRLGFGLEESASATYRQKRFKPSLREGKPITVKFYQPVRYVLVN